MSIRHSTHHGIGFLLGIILSSFITKLLNEYWPGIYEALYQMASNIRNQFNLDLSPYTITAGIIALILVMVYGFLFGQSEMKKNN